MVLNVLTVTSLFLTLLFGIMNRTANRPVDSKTAKSILMMLTGTTIALFGLNQVFFPDFTSTRLTLGIFLIIIGLFDIVNGYYKFRSTE